MDYTPPPVVCPVSFNPSPLQIERPKIQLKQFQVQRNRYGDTPTDISEGIRLAQATPNYMSRLSRLELIVQEFGQPARIERVDRVPDFVRPFKFVWILRARHGTPIAEIHTRFTYEDRYTGGYLVPLPR